MKTPAEYVDAQCKGPERPAMVTHAQATAAVQQALADAERYKNNVLHALRVFHQHGIEQESDGGLIAVGSQELPWRVAHAGFIGAPPQEEPPF